MANERGRFPEAAIALAPTLDGKSRVADADVDQPVRIGRYVVLRRLGQGGMGVVYSAYDADLDRKVAIKVLRDNLQHSATGRTRVLQEAQAMARVAHPNVVHVYEVGRDTAAGDSKIFMAMEFVPGCSLSEWQKRHRGSVSLDELMRPYLQAAAGLSAAHASGLIHRDFKPENVLVGEDGRARVVDFGLARALDGPKAAAPSAQSPVRQGGSGERLTQAGAILGTPGYMAPEQVMGEEADARSDQFSFCVAMYEALYQQLPFAGETFEEFSVNVRAGNLRPPPASRPSALEIPILLDQALRRGLSRDPAARFPSMDALISALVAGLVPDSDSQRSRRLKRRALLAGYGGLALLVLARIVTARPNGAYDLRTSLIIGWATLGVALGFTLVLRRQVRQQSMVRHAAFFFVILGAFMAIGRTVGLVVGMPPMNYHQIECIGMAALLAMEIPYVGKRYLFTVLVALTGATLPLLLPRYSALVMTVCYLLLLILVAFLRPWSTRPEVGVGSDRKK